MAVKTYQGSCHCGAVKYEADVDLAAGTGRCNCSYCGKTRAWNALLKPDAFRLLAGKDATGDYMFGWKVGHHRFCKTCGVTVYGEGTLEQLGGDFVSISVATLDGVSDAELAASPIKFQNGRDNAWQDEPAVKSYL
jgi:hypothetical protein